MSSSVTANMLAEMQGLNRIFPVFELTLGATTYLFAEEPVASASEGLYLPYVTGWSGFAREANTSNFSLVLPSPSVTVFDKDRTLQKAIGGPQKAAIRRSAAECWYRSNAIAAGDHYRFFNGIVTDYGLTGDRLWTFTLGFDDEVLSNGQAKIPYLGPPDFPNAPASVQGEPLWIIYGKHASLGVTDAAGMVKALPAVVDSNGDSVDWVLAYGQLTIQRLYLNGTEDTSNWSFYTIQRGLHRYQMARYTGGGTNPTPDDTVTFDCQGLFAAAPVSGTTTPFENPADCIFNYLAHFVYGDGDVREGVAWDDGSTAPLSLTILGTTAPATARTYFANRGEVMAKVIFANERPIDVFNAWCADFDAVPFLTDTYKIAAIPEDEGELYGDYSGWANYWISQNLGDALSDVSGSTNRSVPVSEIVVSYLMNSAAGSLAASGKSVRDPSAAALVSESFDMSYGDASLIDN